MKTSQFFMLITTVFIAQSMSCSEGFFGTNYPIKNNPNGAAPVTMPQRREMPAEKALTPKQEIAQLNKQIKQVRQEIVDKVKQIAKNNLTDEIKLLQNILNHEQQSLNSLLSYFKVRPEGKPNLAYNRPEVPNWAGCPACE